LIINVTCGVEGDKSAEQVAVGKESAGAADPPLDCELWPAHLADRGAGARANGALWGGAGCRSLHCAGTGRSIGSDIGAANPQVEERSGGDDGHAGDSSSETHTAPLQRLHHATCRVESESAAAGEEHGVNLAHKGEGMEQVGLAGGWRAAAYVHCAKRAGWT